MDGVRRFHEHGATVNEGPLLGLLGRHGEYVLHATESVLAGRFTDWDGECYSADVLALFCRLHRDYLVGIEIKNWKSRVHPKLCRCYLETYRGTCEYFYLAARRFSPSAHSIRDLGLIDLEELRVVKEARYLFPRKELRAGAVRLLKKRVPAPRHIIEDPYQTRLDRFY